jgi:Fibrinogen beta and gamma chains, C-terminal globular domain
MTDLHYRYRGDAGDGLNSTGDNNRYNHNGMKFSTYDVDNDLRSWENCAENRGGGWWYHDCYWVCPTCDDAHAVWGALIPTPLMSSSRMMLKVLM